MNSTPSPATEIDHATEAARTEAWWRFDRLAGGVRDLSGNGHTLTAYGDPVPAADAPLGGVALDGATRWFASQHAVLRTDRSYSVAAWVRLDSAVVGEDIQPPVNAHAWTALSQRGHRHSPFYLGVRMCEEEQGDGAAALVPRWCFSVCAVDEPVPASRDWRHVCSPRPVDRSALDQWTLLVGICDVPGNKIGLYLPEHNEGATTDLPREWAYWPAENEFRVGYGSYLENVAAQWPGSIEAVRVFSGVLTARQMKRLYDGKALAEV